MTFEEAMTVKAGDILDYHCEERKGETTIKVKVRSVYFHCRMVRINAVPIDEDNPLHITECDAPYMSFEL